MNLDVVGGIVALGDDRSFIWVDSSNDEVAPSQKLYFANVIERLKSVHRSLRYTYMFLRKRLWCPKFEVP